MPFESYTSGLFPTPEGQPGPMKKNMITFASRKTVARLLLLTIALLSGWQASALAQNVAPVPEKFTVSHLDANRSSFTFVWSDANGASTIRAAVSTLRSVANPAATCTISIDARGDTLTLSEGSKQLGFIKPGNNKVVGGSLCSVHAQSYKLAKTGTVLTANLIINFFGAMSGDKAVLMQATDYSGASSPLVAMGFTGTFGGVNVTVSITPTDSQLTAGQTQQFAATVSGTTNTAVTWTATLGSVSSAGLYSAPASVTAQTTATVTATSVADPMKTASATVVIHPAVSVSVTPASATLTQGQTQQFTASVTGTVNTGVTWTASAGTISESGLYTAPASIAAQTTATVTATSMADPTKKATASVTLIPLWSISGVVYGAPASLTLSGASAATTTTDSAGKYSFTGLKQGSYVVAPSQSGYVFTPSTAMVDVVNSSVSGVNFTAAVAPSSVTLSWAASVSLDVAGYNVYRASITGGPYMKLNSSPVSSLQYLDTTVSSGQTYFYVATAVDSVGSESTYSTEASAAVPQS
jgi:hypothetical protein